MLDPEKKSQDIQASSEKRYPEKATFLGPTVDIHAELKGNEDLVIEGNGAELIFHGLTVPFIFHKCDGVLVKDLTIDWERPPFSVGKVVDTGERGFDVAVLDEFPVEGGEPVGAFMEYDPETGEPRRGGLDVYRAVESTELIGPQLLRVNLNRPIPVTLGVLMVLRHQVYVYNAFRLDGCSNLRIFWNIMLPLSGPAVATVCVLSFIAHWQNFLGPLIYLNSFEKYTVAIGLRMFQNLYGGWPNYLLAASNVALLPVLILFFVAQKYFVQGIVLTGMKG